ncbi:glycine cleavage system aminomethyltransferase GcvT [Pseudogracilibacillus auburnensis]|uniref:Aminomethyltransferase n=1 Tax=Pseudogracilibacillus auburnensis TaxID=1494959 RepID=A0A2V3VE47_9BACI|nr:glycine cleavage system aminomethyltransferase GcvT [Pseudogracilibacillus auburnensis]PXW80023.1 aminomethyltransferase [Pseudogracilibacillus auburnensis]
MISLKRTPLYEEYKQLGAKMIDFGGWELPVQFSSIMHEHEVTRTKTSLFDVSHMGEITVIGEDSLAFLQKLVTNDVAKLTPNKVQYSLMCNEYGGIIDDFLIYMIDVHHYMLVVNAANLEKDLAWLKKHTESFTQLSIRDDSASFALLALQGPEAEKVLQRITNEKIAEINAFTFRQHVYFPDIHAEALVSRTGYTGEDGFEIYLNAEKSRLLWNLLLKAGKDVGIEPAGLGARDTLRFEAGLPLYGQELTESISPIEAGLRFAVKVQKDTNFIGKEIIRSEIENGPKRKMVGIEMMDKGIPRTGYKLIGENGNIIGAVTSGTYSPTLKKNIGLALVNTPFSEIGNTIWVQVRKRKLKAKIVSTPFYRRAK